MRCVKTGFHAHVVPHGWYLYGDAFQSDGGDLLLRICERSQSPISIFQHFHLHTWALWFDENKTSQDQNSTMIVNSGDWKYLGYDGVVTKL